MKAESAWHGICTKVETVTLGKMMSNEILVVESVESAGVGQLAKTLESAGYSIVRVNSAASAFSELETNDYTLIAVDLTGNKDNGVRLVRGLHVASPDTSIIVFTTQCNTRDVLDLLRAGAWDCQTMPVDFERLDNAVFQALTQEKSRSDCSDLRHVLYYDEVTSAETNPMRGFCLSLQGGEERMAGITAPFVVIHGECGTGKYIVADAIHRLSVNAVGPMLRVDLAEVNESKKSETERTECLHQALANAKGGTLLLENIDLLPKELAPDICRTLNEYSHNRKGGDQPGLEVRVIMTYNANSRRRKKQEYILGMIRQVLHPEEIVLPSLRTHPEFIPDLVGQYLAYCRANMQIPVTGVDTLAMRCLLFHDWPGNLRELASVLEGATVLCKSRHLQLHHLPAEMQRPYGAGNFSSLE